MTQFTVPSQYMEIVLCSCQEGKEGSKNGKPFEADASPNNI
jgi:hypothetical protein